MAPGTARTLPELLATRVPGLVVERSSGTVGSGSRLRLRGASGVYFSNQPLVVVDGIRYIGDERSITIDVGGTAPSRLDDFDPEDVESIRVLSGPAAAAQYGAEGKNGVIEVQTRRGEGRAMVRGFVATGVRTDPTSYPANFDQVESGTGFRRCTVLRQVDDGCVPYPDSLMSANPMKDASPFRTGTLRTVGASVSGSVPLASYYVAGSTDEDVGVLDPNRRERTGFRGNLALRPSTGTELRVTAVSLRGRLSLPMDGASGFSRFYEGLISSPLDPTGPDGFPLPWAGHREYSSSQEVRRTTLGVRGEWSPFHWITAGAFFGEDRLVLGERQTVRVGDASLDHTTTVDTERRLRSVGIDATVSHYFRSDLRSVSTLGWERVSDRLDTRLKVSPSPTGVDGWSREAVEGAYLRQQLAWGERVVLNGALRVDDPPGRSEMEARVSSSLGVEWLAVRDALAGIGVDEVRFRAGYGSVPTQFRMKAGRPPCTEIQCPGGEPREEVVREIEAGGDLVLFGARAGAALTAYDRETRDMLAWGSVSGVGGIFAVLQNAGTVRNRGVEVLLRADLVTGTRLSWSADLVAAVNRNQLKLVGYSGLAGSGTWQISLDGHSLGSYAGFPILGFEDLNGDGFIGLAECTAQQCELQVGTSVEHLGSSMPTRVISFGSQLGLFGFVNVNTRLEHQGGARLLNLTQATRCYTVCREAYDRGAPLETQAAIAALNVGSYAGFIEDADFVKLRELSVTLSAPATLARRVGAAGLDLTLAGRNLATWTGYTGFDPEVTLSNQSQFQRTDFFTQPLTRQWTTRLDVRF